MALLEQIPNILACSDCFQDIGLKLEAEKNGEKDDGECPRCNAVTGSKLNEGHLFNLASTFFVNGSRIRTSYGGSVAVQYNEHHYKDEDVNFPEAAAKDAKIIAEILKIGFFLYAPRLWMLGFIEPLESLQKPEERNDIIERILAEFPKTILKKDSIFYRLRANPQQPLEVNEYDSAPEEHLAKGRLDTKELPILYGSFDIEACLHECRVTLEQSLYLCTMSLTRDLQLLDLTAWVEEKKGVTEFESLNLSVQMLFDAPAHAYEIIRAIAVAAKQKGFDGLIYPSYFCQIHASNDIVKNIGLFGRPVQEGKVIAKCINRVVLSKVIYDYQFGPADF